VGCTHYNFYKTCIREEKKEPTDDTGTDVYSQLVKSQHVSGIIMPIVRGTTV